MASSAAVSCSGRRARYAKSRRAATHRRTSSSTWPAIAGRKTCLLVRLSIEDVFNRKLYLHQSLRVVTGPLFEVTPLRESTKFWKCRSRGNPIEGSLERVLMSLVRYEPSINVIHDLLCFCFTMADNEILLHPRNDVVLERALYKLVKKVG